METFSKTASSHPTREKEPSSGVVSECFSLPSYKDYPAHRPFIHTRVHHTPQTRILHSCLPLSPRKAFPETSSAAILSALRNLQEKIRKLELEKEQAERSLRSLGKGESHTPLRGYRVAQRLVNSQTEKETSGQTKCNKGDLVTHLATSESRCAKLEQQLDHMRGMLRRTDRTSLLNKQGSVEKTCSADQKSDTVSDHVQLEKLEQLEQGYRQLQRAQKNADIKICELERKLQLEEHQRKLIQDKTNQLQTGLEANRVLLQSVSPRLSLRQTKEKKVNSKKSSPHQSSYVEPHYRLSFKDVPFIAGTSVAGSHSVRANVQAVISLLKKHQPHLCNSCVLSCSPNGPEAGGLRRSDSSSSLSSASGEELSELLRGLQEELQLMNGEQDELRRQVEHSVSEEKRKELQREQERLLLKMERKGEQISKLYKHKSQVKKLRKKTKSRQNSGKEVRLSSRGCSAGAIRPQPGERSKRNLVLLRDMKALQASLQT